MGGSQDFFFRGFVLAEFQSARLGWSAASLMNPWWTSGCLVSAALKNGRSHARKSDAMAAAWRRGPAQREHATLSLARFDSMSLL